LRGVAKNILVAFVRDVMSSILDESFESGPAGQSTQKSDSAVFAINGGG
jgi:hypothetical protein